MLEEFKRRNKLLIYPSVQRRMIALFFLAGCLGFVGLTLGAWAFSYFLFQYLEPIISSQGSDSVVQITSMWNFFWIFVSAFGLFYVIFLFVLGLMFSHRTAGPLYRIATDLSKMISNGQFKKIEIRQSDYFEEAVEQINAAIESHNSKK